MPCMRVGESHRRANSSIKLVARRGWVGLGSIGLDTCEGSVVCRAQSAVPERLHTDADGACRLCIKIEMGFVLVYGVLAEWLCTT